MRGKGRPLQKGHKLSKGHGRPALPEEIKQARSLNQLEIERVLNKYLYATNIELQAVLEDESTPQIDRIVIRIITVAALEGDHTRLNFLLDRLVGKAKEPEKVVTFNFQGLPKHEVIEIGKEAIRYLEGTVIEGDEL